ncbi:MAG: hypothetical protein ACD_56C00024G0001 [uncultured bacterium]|nr:MAG: hypothetical protein ACD_56C00024G0001 [uncultured bacterium]
MKKDVRTLPASNFVGTLYVNAFNLDLDDRNFRQFIQRTLPIVIFNDSDRIEAKTLEMLSAKHINKVFSNKEVIVRGYGLEMEIGKCEGCAAGKNGRVTIKLSSGKKYSFIPDSSTVSGNKVAGVALPKKLHRISIELKKSIL